MASPFEPLKDPSHKGTGAAFASTAALQNVEALLLALQAQVDALGLALVPRTGQTTCYDGLGDLTTCGTGIGLLPW